MAFRKILTMAGLAWGAKKLMGKRDEAEAKNMKKAERPRTEKA